MQLNGIDLVGYTADGFIATFTLAADMEAALALDGRELKVTDGGEEVAVFGGYELSGVERDGEDRVRATFARRLDSNVSQAISAIEANARIADRNITAATAAADAARSAASDATVLANANAEAIEELAAAVFTE